MVHDLAGSYPVLRVCLQHLLQQVHGLGVHRVVLGGVQVEDHVFVVVVHLLELFSREQRAGCQQNVEDDPRREDITNRRDLLSLLQRSDLRRHIARSPTTIEDVILRLSKGRQSEIDQHRLKSTLEHDILRFDIPMQNILLMHMSECLDQSSKDDPHLGKAEPAASSVDLLVQVPAVHQLEHHVEGVLGFEDALEFYEVWMVD